jgi:DNA polymerase
LTAKKRVAFLDFETTCDVDLKKTGASKYSRDQSLIVTVAAWAFDNGPVQSVVNTGTDVLDLPKELVEHIESGGIVSGWNSGGFEYNVLKNHFGLKVSPGQVTDTMQRALHAGLPGALGDCGPALRLNIVKDATAHRLMMQMAKPRKHRGGKISYWHIDDPEKLARLRAYCEKDVEAEREIAKYIPELPEREQRISALDRAANERGIKLDVRLIEKMIALADEATEQLNARCSIVTKGAVTSPGTQTARMSAWLAGRGLPVDSLAKGYVEDALKRVDTELANSPAAKNEKKQAVLRAVALRRDDDSLYPILAAVRADPFADVRETLQLRQVAAKSSVKKLRAMLNCMEEHDQCVRGVLAYYGASRTGRWCLAEGSMVRVLTADGVETEKPIEAVTTADHVWDGESWVQHEGVVFSGEKEVISHDGVVATREHQVFISADVKVPLVYAKEQNLPLWRGVDP